MKNRLRIIFLLFVVNVCTITWIHAQELTGIWRGHFRSNNDLERLTGTEDRFSIDDRYKMEVQIAQTYNRFEAITYSYKNTEFYGKAQAVGSLNTKTKKVLLKEGKLLEVRPAYGQVCIMTCFMLYTKLGDEEYLQGTYYSKNSKDSGIDCGGGSIFLHRVVESDFHKEPFLEKKEKELLARKGQSESIKYSNPPFVNTKPPVSMKKSLPAVKTSPSSKTLENKKSAENKTGFPPPTVQKKSTVQSPESLTEQGEKTPVILGSTLPVPVPSVLQTRTNDFLKTITVNHRTIEIRIYDDGAIDNDTVSVYYDNKLIISKARLTDQAISMQIPVEPSEHPHQLVMVAENLGDIPPNTSLLVVIDGEKRYEERIISTEQKNVVVGFLYKKIE